MFGVTPYHRYAGFDYDFRSDLPSTSGNMRAVETLALAAGDLKVNTGVTPCPIFPTSDTGGTTTNTGLKLSIAPKLEESGDKADTVVIGTHALRARNRLKKSKQLPEHYAVTTPPPSKRIRPNLPLASVSECRRRHRNRGCCALSASHRPVRYYWSGRLGGKRCLLCSAMLLPKEDSSRC